MILDFWLWRYAGNPVIWAILALALFCFVMQFHLLLGERATDRKQWQEQAAIWLKVLPVLISALPLLGLVGTINGMIETFGIMARDSSADHQTLMSGGIADALITTQLGLITSVPGILICGWLRYRYKQSEIVLKPSLQERLEQQHGHGIDLAPMLDFVMNLLIFFIITSVVVKETGVEVEKPQASTAQNLPQEVIELAITADGQVVYDHTNIGVDGVRATVAALLAAEERPVVVAADRDVRTEQLVQVMDEAKLAGAKTINIAARVAR